MFLTLNQTLFIILTVAAVVAVVFLVLFLIQLRKTAREGERALIEIREAAEGLQEIERKANERIDDVAELLRSSKQAAAGLAEAGLFLSTKIVRPAARFWPILYPLLRMGWRHLKKKKET